MTESVRRATAFALLATLALTAPVLGTGTVILFAAVAGVALAVTEGRAFDLLARPGDRKAGRLHGLAAFSLAATGLAMLTSLLDLPLLVFATVVVLVGYGNLGEEIARQHSPKRIAATSGFVVAAFLAGVGAQVAVLAAGTRPVGDQLPELVFLAASGALLAALLRSILFERDDPLVMFLVALLLWLFADLPMTVTVTDVAIALAVTAVFGYLSWALDTASIPGMLTGVLLSMLTIVLGGYDWFAVLISFFAIGGLATKYRYGRKMENGVAEDNHGARGSGNVLGNAAVALVAVLAFAASAKLPVHRTVFLFAFAGSIATAMSDTLSSEIGGVFDDPRLITTLQPVEPGTDGGVTWQGEVAGTAGAVVVAAIAAGLFDTVDPAGGVVITLAGVGGMTVDSLLGATVEGRLIGNQSVNLLATLSGAVFGAGLAAVAGLSPVSP